MLKSAFGNLGMGRNMAIFWLQKGRKSNNREADRVPTLNDFFDKQFFPHIEVHKKRPEHDRLTYNKHFRASIGRFPLDKMTNEVLDGWVRDHIQRGYKPSTVNKHIFLLNRMLNMARHWGLVSHNAFETRQIKKLPTGDYKQRFLTEPEVDALLTACKRDPHPFLYLFAKLLVLTGARKGEALNALWRDMNLEERVWHVPVSKNGRSRRIVLCGASIETLAAIRARAQGLGLPTGNSDSVFLNPKTRKRYDSFYAAWHRARAEAGLEEVRIHDLRHTYASLLINKGVTLYEVQTLLGHCNASMTQRYAHLMPNRLHNKAELVGEIFGGI